jgi:hypothetical protein
MTSQEFVIWLKGFTEGVHEFNVTPKQWDILKERLSEVEDNPFVEQPGTFQDHSLQSYPPYWSPLNPFYTTSGTSGSIDISGVRSAVSMWRTDLTGSGTTTVTSGSSWGGPVTYTYPHGVTVTYTGVGPTGSWFVNDKTLLHD